MREWISLRTGASGRAGSAKAFLLQERRPTLRFVDYGALFNALLARAYDSIVISSAQEGWILECSESFVALTGYSREELLGRTSLELQLIDPDIRAAALDAASRQGPRADSRLH